MDSIDELQRRIDDYERNRVRYERMIRRLQDDIFNRDNEIRRTKYTMLQALPELNPPEIDPFVDIVRLPGHLDKEFVRRALLEAYLRDPNDHNSEATKALRAETMADVLQPHWRLKIYGNWRLYVEGEDGVQMENPEISDIKDRYGEELYDAIKRAWLEAQEMRRTGVTVKPWDYEAQRELTLTELLGQLPALIHILREPHNI